MSCPAEVRYTRPSRPIVRLARGQENLGSSREMICSSFRTATDCVAIAASSAARLFEAARERTRTRTRRHAIDSNVCRFIAEAPWLVVRRAERRASCLFPRIRPTDLAASSSRLHPFLLPLCVSASLREILLPIVARRRRDAENVKIHLCLSGRVIADICRRGRPCARRRRCRRGGPSRS